MKPVKEKQVGTINGTIKEREKQIVSLLEFHEGLSVVAIAAQLNVGLRTLMRSIKPLSDNGVIEYRGAKKNRRLFYKIEAEGRSRAISLKIHSMRGECKLVFSQKSLNFTPRWLAEPWQRKTLNNLRYEFS